MIPIITIKEAEKILKTKQETIEISLDLGLSLTTIRIKESLVYIEENRIPLQEFSKAKEETCYIIEQSRLTKLAFFSNETDLYYKLIPTKDWPTVKQSATPMHRHTKTSPKEDTISKIKEIQPVKGKIMDTCCGLGYTAILSSKNAEEVYTFEKDANMVQMARLNPHSQELFNSKKIKLTRGDICEAITRFEDNFFDRIIHDPPTFKRDPSLYRKEFYQQLYRVLKKGGIIYHYAPWPQKTKNKAFYKSIIKKLKECGFTQTEYKPESSGIRAVKPLS